MKAAAVECTGLAAGYGAEVILDHVDFSVAPGELLPIIGPNGGGKSTFLRALLGLVPLRRGRLRLTLDGKPPGYVPQHHRIDPLYPVSARAIVAMGLYPELGPWRRPDRHQRRRIDQALERFGLDRHQKKHFGELSGGLRQKCLLARAFVTGAELFFLDEPTAGLDAASERWFLQYLVDLNRQEGKTILLAHHRLEDLSFLSPTVCRVDRGRVARMPAAQATHPSSAEPGDNP